MNYTLYGSQTSPFVRRIRMLMEGLPYEFKEMDIYGADAKALKEVNPVNQIPVLVDGDQKIWDSRQIFNYLNLMHKLQNMDWEDENLLTAIDGAMSSAVALLLMKRSGMKVDDSLMYVGRQTLRIETVLEWLKPYIKDVGVKNWNFHTMSLYSFLDWATFREIITLEGRPECQALLDAHAERQIVKETAIPRS